jgi:hypothetical protein
LGQGSGLDKSAMAKRKPAVKDGMTATPAEDKKVGDEDKDDDADQDGDVIMASGTTSGGGDSSVEGNNATGLSDEAMRLNVNQRRYENNKAPIRDNSQNEGKHDEGKHNTATDEKQSTTPPEGFAKLIDGYGEPFKNSRSRKSIVFVPEDKTKPLRGWKSLRNAGLSSKKVGSITKNGHSVFHTAKDGSDGRMYFLNNTAWKGLRRRKKVVMED